MKVILQQDVKGQGKKGQLVEVSDGYGRNFLLPRKLAVEATSDNLNTMLKGLTVKIYAKTGKDGRLFGAITSKEISDALKAQHAIDIAKQKIVQEEAIKACGGYQIKCKLGFEITGTIHVMVAEEKH